MSDLLNGRPTTSFWIIGGAALVWNLIGFVLYYMHVTMAPEALAGLTDAQQDFLSATPVWATSAYAIAVNAGSLGGLFLLLRKAWAVPLFYLSFAGIIVQDLDAFVLRGGLDVWGSGGIIAPSIVITVGAVLIWYSRAVKDKGWIA